MSLVINTNIPVLTALRSLTVAESAAETAMERLSTGQRINSASDDPTGMAISTSLTSQIMGADQAVRNSNDGVSLLETAEGGLDEIADMFQRIRELKVEYDSGTTTATQKGYLDNEFEQLVDEIGSVIETTKYNGVDLLSGGSYNMTLQKGYNDNESMTIGVSTLQTATAITTITGTITDATGAASATSMAGITLANVDSAIEKVSSHRTQLGAQQNRLEYNISNLQHLSENVTEARSRILDADFAKESAELARSQILQQAGLAVISQANLIPRQALSLIQS